MGPCYDTDRLIALGLDPRVQPTEPKHPKTGPGIAGKLLAWLRRWWAQPRTVTESPTATRPPSVTRA